MIGMQRAGLAGVGRHLSLWGVLPFIDDGPDENFFPFRYRLEYEHKKCFIPSSSLLSSSRDRTVRNLDLNALAIDILILMPDA